MLPASSPTGNCSWQRRPAVYWARVAAAIGTVLFWVYALASGSFWKPTLSAGYEVFHALVHPIFLICLGIGAFTTSLSLFDEKRHGTLPLLLLTRIGPLGVVLGKLAAVSIYSGQILLGTLPVLGSCFAWAASRAANSYGLASCSRTPSSSRWPSA